MKGFTIKCNACGKEVIWDDKNDDQTIGAYPDYDHNVTVMCDCGNELRV